MQIDIFHALSIRQVYLDGRPNPGFIDVLRRTYQYFLLTVCSPVHGRVTGR